MPNPPEPPLPVPLLDDKRPVFTPGEVTIYFEDAARGSLEARNWILSELMSELLVTARETIRRKRFSDVRAGEVITDTYFRLSSGAFRACGDRAEFLRYAGRAMHYVLIDAMRRRTSQHAGPLGSVSFTAGPTAQAQEQLVLELIEDLRATRPHHALYCELRYVAERPQAEVEANYPEFSAGRGETIRRELKAMLEERIVERT